MRITQLILGGVLIITPLICEPMKLPKTALLSKDSIRKPSLIGCFAKRDLITFIHNEQVQKLFHAWMIVQCKKKTVHFYAYHHYLYEFELEEKMRSIWGKNPVKIIQEERIALALTSVLSTLRMNEKRYGKTLAIHTVLDSLEKIYTPLYEVTCNEEKANENSYDYEKTMCTKIGSDSESCSCYAHILDAID